MEWQRVRKAMSRLTKKFDSGVGHNECHDSCMTCNGAPCELAQAMIDKLAHYEDLKDEGRLIELPCAVGDTVYWISESDACLFCNGPCYERCEEGALKIKEIPFKQHMLNEIGEIIFLTKEEAEAKLKEMEGAE